MYGEIKDNHNFNDEKAFTLTQNERFYYNFSRNSLHRISILYIRTFLPLHFFIGHAECFRHGFVNNFSVNDI